MAYTVKAGTKVWYRDANGDEHHAVVTAITSQTVVDLRVGSGANATAVADLTRRAKGDGLGEGWLRVGRA